MLLALYYHNTLRHLTETLEYVRFVPVVQVQSIPYTGYIHILRISAKRIIMIILPSRLLLATGVTMEYYYRILRKQTLPMNELLHCALYGVHLLILSNAVRTSGEYS